MNQWGRFTHRGSDKVESVITSIVSQAAAAVSSILDPSSYHALVLIGGYGRGEGGVEMLNGREHPHNNLDFLLISKKGGQEWQEPLDRALQPIRQASGVGMDLSVVSGRKLKTAPPLVIWHDMRFGHKTILGNADFVPSLSQFGANRILPSDARNLLVNRGTLLLINEMILEKSRGEANRKTAVRHIVKAIIGYGDALLFFHGQYHWSYAEKQRRMRQLQASPPLFREWYNAAMEFRFQPNYPEFMKRDLEQWMSELRAVLGPIHLECERRRLNDPSLEWKTYPQKAFARLLFENPSSIRGWLKKGRDWARNARRAGPPGALASLGFKAGGWPGALPILYPVITYRLEDAPLRNLAAKLLQANSSSHSVLRQRYLESWGEHCDRNFSNFLNSLDAGPRV